MRAAIALAVLTTLSGCAQSAKGPAAAREHQRAITSISRGLYVTDAASAARDPYRRKLLALIRAERFEHLVLYGLGPLLNQPGGAELLAPLLREAREAGVQSIAVPVAGPDRLDSLREWVRANPELRFDALVTENEYWNRCDQRAIDTRVERPECFAHFVELLERMREAADDLGTVTGGSKVRIGAYLGYPTRAEARSIAGRVDYVLLNYNVPTPDQAWGHVHPSAGPLSDRLRWFLEDGVEVWPIFYVRGEAHMGAWVKAHGLAPAEAIFRSAMDADSDAGGSHLRLGGFQYFADDALIRP